MTLGEITSKLPGEWSVSCGFSGEILKFWIYAPGRPGLCVLDEFSTEVELNSVVDAINNAWRFRDAEEVVAKQLQLKYPGKQVYKSHFPQTRYDMESPAGVAGDAVYVLKNRRKNGKYRVLDYILINQFKW